MTINEVRQNEDLEEVEGGDVIYMPFSLQPVGGMIEGVTDTVRGFLGKKSDKEDGMMALPVKKSGKQKLNLGAPIPPRKRTDRKQQIIQKKVKHDVMKLIVSMLKTSDVDKNGDVTESKSKRDAYWKQMIAKTDVLEQRMIQMIKDAATEQETIVMTKYEYYKDSLKKGNKLSGKSFAFSLRDENKRWTKLFKPFITGIVLDKGNEVLLDLGVIRSADGKTKDVFNLNAQMVVEFLKKLGLGFVAEVNEFTRAEIIRAVEEGLRSDDPPAVVQKRIKDVYDGLKGYRANRIARTETLRGTNFGTYEAYRQSGVVAAKEWLAALDERTRPTHADADGQVVPVDKPFNVGGTNMMYPGDPAGGASETCNCRCTTIPVTQSQVNAAAQNIEEKDANKKIKVDKIVNEVGTFLKQKELEEKTKEVEQIKKKKVETKEKTQKELEEFAKKEQERIAKKIKEAAMEDEAILKAEQEDLEKDVIEKREAIKNLADTVDKIQKKQEVEQDILEQEKQDKIKENEKEILSRMKEDEAILEAEKDSLRKELEEYREKRIKTVKELEKLEKKKEADQIDWGHEMERKIRENKKKIDSRKKEDIAIAEMEKKELLEEQVKLDEKINEKFDVLESIDKRIEEIERKSQKKIEEADKKAQELIEEGKEKGEKERIKLTDSVRKLRDKMKKALDERSEA